MGYTFPGEETQKFQEYANNNQNYWTQRKSAVERLPVFDDGELCDSVGRECWDDTHKSRSVIKFVLRPMSGEVVPSHLLTRRDVFVVFLLVCATREV